MADLFDDERVDDERVDGERVDAGRAGAGRAGAGPDRTNGDENGARSRARKRLEKRRSLEGGAVAYLVVNAFLVGVWALTGRGYFWPVWVMGGWGIGMVLGVWDYVRGPVSEADIDAELQRRGRGRG